MNLSLSIKGFVEKLKLNIGDAGWKISVSKNRANLRGLMRNVMWGLRDDFRTMDWEEVTRELNVGQLEKFLVR